MVEYPKVEGWAKMHPDIVLADTVVVTEKLDGANMRVMVTQTGDAVYGSRGVVLTTDESKQRFFKGLPINWWEQQVELRLRLADVAKRLGAPRIIVFGEIIGWAIQKRIRYLPSDTDVDFYAFDIYANGNFLPYSEMLRICESVGLKHVPVLYVGSPQSPEFTSLVERVLSGELYSAVVKEQRGEDSVAEGVVVRTEPLMRSSLGAWCITKIKSPAFSEGGERKFTVVGKEGASALLTFLSQYVTLSRLENVVLRLRADGIIDEPTPADLKHIAPAFWNELMEDCADAIQQLVSSGVDEREIKHRVGKMLQRLYLQEYCAR